MLEKITKDLANKKIILCEDGYMITLCTNQADVKDILIYLKEQKFNILTDLPL